MITTLMTRPDFEQWLRQHRRAPLASVGVPVLVACDCGDVNCHGWRFVASAASTGLEEVRLLDRAQEPLPARGRALTGTGRA